MPALIKLLLRHAAIGFGAAAIFVSALLISDTGGIGTLVARSDMAALAVFLLTFFTGLTFASAQMGFAVMSGDGMKDRGPRGGQTVIRLRLEAPRRDGDGRVRLKVRSE